ncbi:hypothetical protein DAEQUDRAFT_814080 [Daedalea quercina L-15889]|uniref:Uncharacterized protein n=1 Tax=Daedalea quercina L-15889 TaxID=1314783 RepID=A0A165MGX8_9APHY|nr:hypothetical protein DAEQUDRAFT_814080 [Daedalea quercina L-15889]
MTAYDASLSQAMRLLNLQCDVSPTTTATGRDRIARYPELPANWRKQDRFYILGWDMDNTRLKELVQLHTPPDMVHVPYAVRAKRLLEDLSGCSNLHISAVLPPRPSDELCQSKKGTRTIVAISFTASTRLYFRRPTQKQYNLLVQIFGGQPIWHRDALPKFFFGAYCIS